MPEPRALLDAAVADGVMSAAVLRVEDLVRGEPLLSHVVGRTSAEPPGAAARADSRFDLASLTKLITATAALRLVSRGQLDLDADVAALRQEADGLHAGMTPRHLLEHSSGLPAWAPLWESGAVRDVALATPREAEPGARHRYSDIGFLVLADVLERVAARPLQELLHDEVLGPFGLERTTFRDRRSTPGLLATGDVVATEVCPDRGFLVGTVSDRNTWHLGGVAPHAGLFGPAADLAAFARAFWSSADTGLLAPGLFEAVWQPPAHPGGHVLGWDTVAPEGYTSAGRVLSPGSRGHLAFTGCSLWIDPERAIAVIHLCNRIHPTRDDVRIRTLRPALHDAVARAVDALR